MKIVLIFLTLFFLGCDKKTDTTFEEKAYKNFDINEEVNLKSVTGGNLTLIRTQNGFKIKNSNKILLIDIFGTYCAPCQAEAPMLSEFTIKNSDNFAMVALTHFEDVSDEFVIENFVKKYNAYYFISNDKEKNGRIVAQIEKDIKYERALGLPFKVIYKNGVEQNLTNNETLKGFRNFYIGKVGADILKNDIKRIAK